MNMDAINPESFCLQIKKSKASDYFDYILDLTSLLYPEYMSITCEGEKVYEWDKSSSSFLLYRNLILWISFIFLLF